MLVTDRRRGFPMRDEDCERNPWQGSLFGPDSLAPPARPSEPMQHSLAPPARPPGPTPDPLAPPPTPLTPPDGAGAMPADDPVASHADCAPLTGVAAPADSAAMPADTTAAPADSVAPADYTGEVVAPSNHAGEAVEVISPTDRGELEPAHAPVSARRAVLGGPTLDDVMSRVWEGLRAEVPTPCPVCRAEIEPSAGGRCGACGSALH